jgi:hypothetical protein
VFIVKSLNGAEAAVDANILGSVAELLESPSADVRMWTCRLLGWLGRFRSTTEAVLSIEPCKRLVSLLRRVLIIRARRRC